MRAGRPMLVVPYAHDQPDNALRARKLGIAASVSRNAYSGETAAAALGPLLADASVAARAASVGEIVSRETEPRPRLTRSSGRLVPAVAGSEDPAYTTRNELAYTDVGRTFRSAG